MSSATAREYASAIKCNGMTLEFSVSCGNQEGWVVAWATGNNAQGIVQPFALTGAIPPITNPLGPQTNAAGEIVNTIKLMQGYCPSGCTGLLGSWSPTAQMGAASINKTNSANSNSQIILDAAPGCSTFTANTDGSTAILKAVSLGTGCNWSNLSLGYGVNGTGIASGSHITWMDPVVSTITLDKTTTSVNSGTTVNLNELDYLVQAQDSGSDYFSINGSATQSMIMPALLPSGWKATFYTTNTGSPGGTLTPQSGVTINGSTSAFSFARNTPYFINIPGQNNAAVK